MRCPSCAEGAAGPRIGPIARGQLAAGLAAVLAAELAVHPAGVEAAGHQQPLDLGLVGGEVDLLVDLDLAGGDADLALVRAAVLVLEAVDVLRLGGDVADNVAITRNILEGREKGPKRNVVLLNSAAALVAAGKSDTIRAGLTLAEQSIDSGKAMEKLTALAEYTQKNG